VLAGVHKDAPWFRWHGGVIHYTFEGMEAADRAVVQSAMASIEQRTCLRFQEEARRPAGHRLLVRGGTGSCIAGAGVPT
jgi:hypothetical protein